MPEKRITNLAIGRSDTDTMAKRFNTDMSSPQFVLFFHDPITIKPDRLRLSMGMEVFNDSNIKKFFSVFNCYVLIEKKNKQRGSF